MRISDEAKKWIEDNIEYLDDLNLDDNQYLDKLMRKVPMHLFNEVKEVLGSIVDFKETEGSMYGIKSVGDVETANGRPLRRNVAYRTISIGQYDKVNSVYNINYTITQGMKGGHQVGFKSVKDAEEFISKLPNPASWRPSKMIPATVDKYKWIEVDIIYGKAWITDVAFNKYDPTSAAKNRLKNRADKDIFNAGKEYMRDNIDISSIYSELQNYNDSKVEVVNDLMKLDIRFTQHYLSKNGCMFIHNVIASDNEIDDIVKIIQNNAKIPIKLLDTYRSTGGLSAFINIWIVPDTPEFNQIEPNIYAKYGI